MPDFKSIIDQYHPLLYKIGRSYTDEVSDFEDLYQEMLIQIWQSLKNFRQQSKLSTWIYKVALNTALTYRKKQRRKLPQVSTELIKELDQPTASTEDTLDQEAEINLLYESIKALKKDDRALILLHLEGKQYHEIAEIMGITTSNVGVKLLRIKKKLFELLKARGYARV